MDKSETNKTHNEKVQQYDKKQILQVIAVLVVMTIVLIFAVPAVVKTGEDATKAENFANAKNVYLTATEVVSEAYKLGEISTIEGISFDSTQTNNTLAIKTIEKLGGVAGSFEVEVDENGKMVVYYYETKEIPTNPEIVKNRGVHPPQMQ